MTNAHANLLIEQAEDEVRRGRLVFAIKWLEQVKRRSRDLVVQAQIDERIEQLRSVQAASF